MNNTLSPSQVARALQVSESSVKRWCDQGTIEASYTAGGHRRITLRALMQFLKSARHQLIDPAAVGLPAGTGDAVINLATSSQQLEKALAEGNIADCRRVVYGLFLAETSPASICDLVISPAINRLGDIWECGELDAYQERRGCEMVQSMLHELSSLTPAAPPGAPIAIGGGIEHDPYSLATQMVALVLKDAKWNATSLGPGLPLASFEAAIRREQPYLFWLSISHLQDAEDFIARYNQLCDMFAAEVAFVIGGSAITPETQAQLPRASFCDTLKQLEHFATTLLDQHDVIS